MQYFCFVHVQIVLDTKIHEKTSPTGDLLPFWHFFLNFIFILRGYCLNLLKLLDIVWTKENHVEVSVNKKVCYKNHSQSKLLIFIVRVLVEFITNFKVKIINEYFLCKAGHWNLRHLLNIIWRIYKITVVLLKHQWKNFDIVGKNWKTFFLVVYWLK